MVDADLPLACFPASEMSTLDVGERVLRANWNKSSSSSSGQDIVEACIENSIKRQKSNMREVKKAMFPQIEFPLRFGIMVIRK